MNWLNLLFLILYSYQICFINDPEWFKTIFFCVPNTRPAPFFSFIFLLHYGSLYKLNNRFHKANSQAIQDSRPSKDFAPIWLRAVGVWYSDVKTVCLHHKRLWLTPGAYSGFYKGGCGRGASENFFSHPGAKLLRTHPFRTTPLFAFLLFWTNFKKNSQPGAKLLRTHLFLHPLLGGELLLLALLRG